MNKKWTNPFCLRRSKQPSENGSGNGNREMAEDEIRHDLPVCSSALFLESLVTNQSWQVF
jgi:hypothetical protein